LRGARGVPRGAHLREHRGGGCGAPRGGDAPSVTTEKKNRLRKKIVSFDTNF